MTETTGAAETTASPAPPSSQAGLTALWSPLAFLSSVCGIGGGLFAVPLLHYVGKREIKRSVATSTVLVFVLSFTGTLAESLQRSPNFIWPTIAALGLGGWLGAHAGFWASKRVDGRAIKRVFVFVLLFSSYRVLAVSSPEQLAASADAHALDALHVLIVLVIGFGGGFIAPILGVGGGLLVVPALYLSFPTISILEARACSVAMTILTSGQSAYLHWRSGAVDTRGLAWLAPATIAASALGVFMVHRPGWAEFARVGLGCVLLLVAARFAWDAFRPAPTRSD
jgi:uncharacterized membrane protein YfcA